MSFNLAVYIIQYMLFNSVGEIDEEVQLTNLMHENDIPRATFYRYVNNLIDMKIIQRSGRGMYKFTETQKELFRKVSRPKIDIYPISVGNGLLSARKRGL